MASGIWGPAPRTRARRARLALAVAALTCALTLALGVSAHAATVLAWGDNINGELGSGSLTSSTGMAQPMSDAGEVQSLAADGPLALLEDGTVLAWGPSGAGQLGDGQHSGPEECANPCSRTPLPVPGLEGVTAVAAGAGGHRLALLGDGHVMAWGRNGGGQVGDGTTVEKDSPVEVSGIGEARSVAAGELFSLALLEDGEVLAWGDNGQGELGNGTTASSAVPVHVSGLSGVTAISAAGASSLALLSNGHVMAWGEKAGLPGHVPVEVQNLTEAVAVSGGLGGLALLADGHVVHITEGEHPGALEVPGLSEAMAVASTREDHYALLSSGTAVAWGSASLGALGGGNPYLESASPRGVCGVSGATALSPGRAYIPGGEPTIPAVFELSPYDGPLTGGETVIVHGRHLGEAQSVRFGATSVPFKALSDSSLQATSPAGEAPVEVTVSSPAGTSVLCPADEFRFEPAPTVIKVAPRTGPATGGVGVLLSGTHLTPSEVSVSFGSVAAASVRWVGINSKGEEKVEAVSPPQTAGIVGVTATTNGGTSAVTAADRYKVAPVITELSPSEGPAAGGNTVTITGAGFVAGAAGTTVKFGTAKGTHLTCPSSTECSVVAPAHAAGTVTVKMTVNKVTATSPYTYR